MLKPLLITLLFLNCHFPLTFAMVEDPHGSQAYEEVSEGLQKRLSDLKLPSREHLEALEELDLRGVPVSDSDLSWISVNLLHLKSLNLSAQPRIGSKGIQNLAKLKELTFLDLSHTPLSSYYIGSDKAESLLILQESNENLAIHITGSPLFPNKALPKVIESRILSYLSNPQGHTRVSRDFNSSLRKEVLKYRIQLRGSIQDQLSYFLEKDSDGNQRPREFQRRFEQITFPSRIRDVSPEELEWIRDYFNTEVLERHWTNCTN